MEPRISIIIPAFNEEANLEGTVHEVLQAIGHRFYAYEILVVDDGSTDRTGAIAESLATADPGIRAIHNGQNMGFGFSYRTGVQLATCDYVGFVPGDNSFPAHSLEAVFDAVGQADIVIHYTLNPEVRTLLRRIISQTYTLLMNFLFGLNLRYFNGISVHRREVIQHLTISTDGFGLLAAILVPLIRSGRSYLEVGVDICERKHGSSKAFRLKNVLSVLKMITLLFLDVQVIHRKQYGQSIRSVKHVELEKRPLVPKQ